MSEDEKLNLMIVGGLAVYIILAIVFPFIVWITIAAAICCWFGGK